MEADSVTKPNYINQMISLSESNDWWDMLKFTLHGARGEISRRPVRSMPILGGRDLLGYFMMVACRQHWVESGQSGWSQVRVGGIRTEWVESAKSGQSQQRVGGVGVEWVESAKSGRIEE